MGVPDTSGLLRDTLAITLAKDDSFPARFYEILFAAHPELRPMFYRNSPDEQNKMLADKLSAIVDNIDDPAWLDRELVSLARKHIGYGVTPEMYGWVREALLVTLAEACGDAWSAEADTAWRAAYAVLAEKILAVTP